MIVTDNGKPFDKPVQGYLQLIRDIESSLHNILKHQIISTKINFNIGMGTIIAWRLLSKNQEFKML